jgi:hypothetical protein
MNTIGTSTSHRCRAAGAFLAALWLTACAAQISDLEGLYIDDAVPPASEQPVRVEFTVVHLAQRHGYDAVPKHRPPLVSEFEEIFRDAVREIEQLSSYTLVTETAPRSGAEVVTRPDQLSESDYSVRMVFLSESSFASETIWGLVAISSMMLFPAPFTADYSIETAVHDGDGHLVATYSRSARITSWVQAFLLFVYPFRPPEGEREALVSTLLRDLFRQMTAEGVLSAG